MDRFPRWAKHNLLQAKLAQSLDGAGFLVAAASSDQQVAASHQLLIDLRDFAITKSPDPVAHVEFFAKLVDKDGVIVAARLFRGAAPAKGRDAPQIAAALDEAFAMAATDLGTWIAQAL